MMSFRSRGFYLLCVYGQLVVTNALFWAWIAFNRSLGQVEFASNYATVYLVYSELLSIGVLLSATVGGARVEFISPDLLTANRLALRQLAISYFCLMTYLVASRDAAISRWFLFTFMPFYYLASLAAHYFLPSLIRRWSFSGAREEHILVAGKAGPIQALGPWLARKAHLGCRTIGMLCNDPQPSISPLPVLGDPDELDDVLRRHHVTQLILAGVDHDSDWVLRAAATCERHGVRFLIVDVWQQLFARSVTHFEDEGVRFVGLRTEPLEDPFNRVAKRLLDIAVALPVTVFILPPLHCFVWLLQRLQSPGPVYHRQQRAGIQNCTFTLYKYRTMYVRPFDEARQAVPDDDRVFPAGRWLRKFSIDELPQFFNVLRGEMSVVGPRPHLLKHNELFSRAIGNYHVRAVVKPGITGLAQVSGFRGAISQPAEIAARVKADIHYLENWSLASDCWIIVRTARQVIAPPATAR